MGKKKSFWISLAVQLVIALVIAALMYANTVDDLNPVIYEHKRYAAVPEAWPMYCASNALFVPGVMWLGVGGLMWIATTGFFDIFGKYAAIMRKDQASGDMTHSFEETVSDLQSDQPRAYFAYYPNQYGDGRHWLQMTLIFARPGSEGGGIVLADATPAPSTDEEYEGYFSQDNYSHLEIFATPTPEPDSAAMERW